MSWGPRLIAYGLVGLFCVPGPPGLIFALNLALHRAAFIHTAVRTEGRQSNPEVAHIDAFSTLWQQSLVAGIWGAVWLSIPVLILVVRRRRRASAES